MKHKWKEFRVDEDRSVDLKKWATEVEPLYQSKEDYQKILAHQVEELSKQQEILYASHSYSLLVIFQAMDAAGKDGVIKHVMSGVNPQGCQVYSFKHPSDQELSHDFLWRSVQRLPERGHIGIFNRSYYEEVLIARVHPHIIAGENIPEELLRDGKIWDERYRSIKTFERHLHQNGTRTLKFYLHISKKEQAKRLIARIDEPDKNWKFEKGDLEGRARWKDYMKAYEHCLEATSTKHAPWFVVPADDKENARIIVANVIVETLRDLKLSYPKVSAKKSEQLKALRKDLSK